MRTLKRLALVAAIGAALVPAIASAQTNRLPRPGTAMGAIMTAIHDVPVCDSVDDAAKFAETMAHYTHHIRPFITSAELYRQKPESCGFTNIGQVNVVRAERVHLGRPVMMCVSIYDDLQSAKNGADSDRCFWTPLLGDDWNKLRLLRIQQGLDPQTGERVAADVPHEPAVFDSGPVKLTDEQVQIIVKACAKVADSFSCEGQKYQELSK